jgi:hypothetical protein
MGVAIHKIKYPINIAVENALNSASRFFMHLIVIAAIKMKTSKMTAS